MRNDISKKLEAGVSPVAMGKAAHRIIDYAVVNGVLYVTTPRNRWHRATAREREILSSG